MPANTNSVSSTMRSARRSIANAILAAAAVAMLSACGGSDNPTAPQTPTHGLRLTNNSQRVVEKVYVSPCSSPTWGENQLASPLAPMGVKVFPVQTSGCYDVRVVAADGHSWRRDNLTVQGTTGVQVE